MARDPFHLTGATLDEDQLVAKVDVVPGGTVHTRCRLLFWAIRYNDADMIDFLLRGNVGTLLTRDAPTFKPLHLAAALGLVSLFNRLLAIPGCTVDDADGEGTTALHYACHGVRVLPFLDPVGPATSHKELRLARIKGRWREA
jgi:hypothetical protein